MSQLDCEVLSQHHSGDRHTLHAGYEDPYYVCGYHASWVMNASVEAASITLEQLRAARTVHAGRGTS
jgi:hypothetical protein